MAREFTGFRNFIKSRTTKGFRNSLRLVRQEYSIQKAHRSSLARLKRFPLERPIKLNVGSGRKFKPGWINIDLFTAEADFQFDMREGLPFADASVEIVYCEHFLEHLDYPDEVQLFLSESFRALIPRGVVSIGVPDTDRALRAYVSGDEEYFRYAREHWHPEWCTTRMHQVNYHFRQGREHKYAYDFETLAQILHGIGFRDTRTRPFDPNLDSPDREKGTLYVEARKP